MLKKSTGWTLGAFAAAFGTTSLVHAQSPDVALCQIPSVQNWTAIGGMEAYSVATTSVNIGTTNLQWVQSNNNHPVIGQNMFRIMDGRIEQVGQSWLKHSFCALQIESNCTTINCPNQGGCLSFLAPGCQDPYSASRNGSQNLLGPKWQVNAFTGQFPYPAANGNQGNTGNSTYLRLQVHTSDLALPGAIYLVEGQYVTNNETPGSGTQRNNASYRLINIAAAPNYSASIMGGQSTEFTKPGIRAWEDHGLGVNNPDPDVVVNAITVPGEGQFLVGRKVKDNGNGTWNYEYAVQNLYSDRSGASFSIPVGDGVNITNIGFHDVDYHSGDGPGAVDWDDTDWEAVVADGAITWSVVEDFNTNPNGNALRWGTLYNFRFDADAPPQAVTGTIGLFKPGSPDSVDVPNLQGPQGVDTPCPGDLDGDGEVAVPDLVALILAWDTDDEDADLNDDGIVGVEDLVDMILAWGDCP